MNREHKGFVSLLLAIAIAATAIGVMPLGAGAIGAATTDVWNTLESSFTGKAYDYGIVWYKYSGDSTGAGWTLSDKDGDEVMTVTSTATEASGVLYGVSAVIKNIQPNTTYEISFKEKASVTNDLGTHGIYLNADTLSTTTSATAPSSETATTRNNKTVDTIHKQSGEYTDTDWHTCTYTWTSGSEPKDGYDTLSAKFTFIIRNASGSFSIKDLKITGVAAENDNKGVWSTYATTGDTTLGGAFSGNRVDDSNKIVWALTKNENDRNGAEYSFDENNVLTIKDNENVTTSDLSGSTVLYGVSAIVKGVQPNTTYTISFKEKSTLTSYASNGVYLNAMTQASTWTSTGAYASADPSNGTLSGTLGTMHAATVTDTDWENYSYTYTTSSGLPDGYDTYEIRLTFMFRGVLGSTQIKDLKIIGPAETSVKGENIDLSSGEITMNVYVAASAVNNASDITYKLGDGKDVTCESETTTISGYGDVYTVTQNIPAAQMADTLKVTVNQADGTQYPYTTSVKDYVNAQLADEDTDENTSAVLTAMLDYGSAVQEFAGVTASDKLANGRIYTTTFTTETDGETTTSDLSALSAYTKTTSYSSNWIGATLKSMNMNLNYNFNLGLNFSSDVSDYDASATLGGNNYTAIDKGEYISDTIVIEGLTAADFSKTLVVTLKDSSKNEYTITMSPMYFVRLLTDSSTTTDITGSTGELSNEQIKVGQMLYKYLTAVEALVSAE